MIAAKDTYPTDLVNDMFLTDMLQLGHPSKSELLFFPHGRPRLGKSHTLRKQIGALDANPMQLHREVELVLAKFGELLKRSSTNVVESLSKAVNGMVPVHVDEKAGTLLVTDPSILGSAVSVASSLSDLVQSYGILRLDIKRVYDIELETEKIVIGLRTDLNPHDSFECETQILSHLDKQLSDDDKLRIAVRIE